jgi:hypothetical protein
VVLMLVLSPTSKSGNTPETARVSFKTATYADAKEAFGLNLAFLVVASDVSDSQATLRDTARFRVFLKLEQQLQSYPLAQCFRPRTASQSLNFSFKLPRRNYVLSLRMAAVPLMNLV